KQVAVEVLGHLGGDLAAQTGILIDGRRHATALVAHVPELRVHLLFELGHRLGAALAFRLALLKFGRTRDEDRSLRIVNDEHTIIRHRNLAPTVADLCIGDPRKPKVDVWGPYWLDRQNRVSR